MKKIIDYINNSNVSRFRSWFQLLAFVILVYGAYFSIWISNNLPVLSCSYNSGNAGTCYFIRLQHHLHISWADLFSYRGLSFLAGFGGFILMFIILSKAWCGYACPLGTIQDWITKFREFLGIRFTKYDKKTSRRIKPIKYILLGLTVIIPLGVCNSILRIPKFSHNLSSPFCQICPARRLCPTASLDTSNFFIDYSSVASIIMSSLGMMVTALFLVGSFVKKRFFCLICPLSALQYPFTKIGLLRLSKTGHKCTGCGNCSKACDPGIYAIEEDIKNKNIVKDDCTMCFKCVEVCPEDDCLKVSFLGIPLFKSTKAGFLKRKKKKR